MKRKLLVLAFGLMFSSTASAQMTCAISAATVSTIQSKLTTVVQSGNGGLFTPNHMWSAVVDRSGNLCSVISSDSDAWPGSRSIAIAKASTANNFSNKELALSTANLYSLGQPANTQTSVNFPAGSLFGLNTSNPFNPAFQAQGTGVQGPFVPGGIITFGGGVALYDSGGNVIGGLGLSGDTACADHAIAYRMRNLAGFDHTPNSDNIVYLDNAELPHDLGHRHCYNGHDITP
jgi:uncharacterized protein GlcG (DUF336 family)